MPKIIKNGINYTPAATQPDEITIVYNGVGKLSVDQTALDIPEADGVTIMDSEGVLSVIPSAPQMSDWDAAEGEDGFIENKPKVKKGTDYDETAVIINDIDNNTASSLYSVAEGSSTTANGKYAHAEGYLTLAGGDGAHAEGESTQALAKNSHAEGMGTITPNIVGAHVQGKYNVNLSNTNFVDIVGWGTGPATSNRKNISALTTDGRLILADTVTIGADRQSQGGYTIPVPSGLEYGKKYVLQFERDALSGDEIMS